MLAEPRARRPRTRGLAILTCSGGDSGIAADDAERLEAELPPALGRDGERLAELLPGAATIGNPLDYTAMIWGDTDLLARIMRRGRRRPRRSTSSCSSTTTPGPRPEAAASWAAVRAGIIAGAADAEAATLVASTLPDLVDDEASGELADRGVPVVAGLADRARVRHGRCAAEPASPSGCASRRRRCGATRRPPPRPGEPDGSRRDRGEGLLREAAASPFRPGAGGASAGGGARPLPRSAGPWP